MYRIYIVLEMPFVDSVLQTLRTWGIKATVDSNPASIPKNSI